MRKSFITLLLFCFCASQAWGAMIIQQFTAAGGGEYTCTGSDTFIRGASASGNSESFEQGSSDTCASDITITSGIGIETYSTGWAGTSGTHSFAVTDDSGTTPGKLRADHGSYQTDQYYRFYVKVPDMADYQNWGTIGFSKYDSAAVGRVYIRDQNLNGTTARVRAGTNSAEEIEVTEGEVYRIEVRVYDADGSGAGDGTMYVKAFESDGTAIETTNGGGDYEIEYTLTFNAFQYVWLDLGYSDSSSQTMYIDDWQNCNTWCGE